MAKKPENKGKVKKPEDGKDWQDVDVDLEASKRADSEGIVIKPIVVPDQITKDPRTVMEMRQSDDAKKKDGQ